MGTWGAGLYEDDAACDVRDIYRDAIAQGHSGRMATDKVLKVFEGGNYDVVEGAIMWLALADTQWRCGRLEDRVKNRALKVIANGAATKKWTENLDPGSARLARTREAMVAKLREKLLSPQPKEKKIRKPFHDKSEW